MIKIIREITLNIKYILNFAYRNQKSYYFFWSIGIILNVINTWLSIFYFKYMIDLLLEEKFRFAAHITVIFAGLIFIVDILSSLVTLAKNIREQKIIDYLKSMLALKQMEMRYDQITDLKTREQYSFAKKVVLEGGIGNIIGSFGSIVSYFITMVGVLFVFTYLNIWIFFIIILVIILNAIGNIKRIQYLYNRYTNETPIERNLYYARDYLTTPLFAKEVRMFYLKDFISSKIKYYIEKYFNLELGMEIAYFKKFWWTYVANGIQLIAVYMYIGYLLYNNTISVSEFSLCISATFIFSSTILESIKSITNLIQSSKYIHDVRAFLNKEEEYIELKKIPLLAKEQFTISFKKVSFKYEDENDYVIKNLDMEIHNHEKICIVGENGAGKTTLINLLMGFYKPTEGTILLNGININHFELHEYLSFFSTVFQEFNLFNFSIGENITMKEEYSNVKVKEAASKAGILEKIDSLRQGVGTYLSQRMDKEGTDLSGGEKQMLAISRAIYKDAPIFILDEPTSALSPQKEYEIYKKFEEITSNKTVIYISHRLSSCKFADKILVLQDGQIIESGTHQQLLSNKNLYEKMFMAQAEYYKTNNYENEKQAYEKE